VLVIIYHLLRDNQDYHDLGPHFLRPLIARVSATRRCAA
jgi:hypothetical protein